MLNLRYARHTISLLSPSISSHSAAALHVSTAAAAATSQSILTTLLPDPNGTQSPDKVDNEIVNYFREWFLSRKKPLLDQIYEILRTEENSSLDSSLSKLDLYLTEELVLNVLRYDRKDVLACLKFFDWAGRQRGFHHTNVTFCAIFRILYNAQMTNLLLEFLRNYGQGKYQRNLTYYSVLVVGYAISGKCEVALQVLGKMRYHGNDMPRFGYQVLLNSLVEQGYFDMAETIVKEIRVRGFDSEVTHSIVVKSMSMQKKLEDAEKYLRSVLLMDGVGSKCGPAVATFIGALCRDEQYERAALLVEEFRKMGVVSMENVYSTWIEELLRAGKVDGGLMFLKDKRAVEGYVPCVFRYNMLVFKLLRQNRFNELLDLLVDMKDTGVLPNDATLNAVLCLLCKVGRMDIAMDLFNSRAEFGLSVNGMAYNYLLNTLLGDASADEAYRVLRNSIEQGYFPGQKTFLIVADALSREGKSDKMRELVLSAIERNIMPTSLTYNLLISNLCKASRKDDGYWVYNLLNRLNKSVGLSTYVNLIREYCKSGRVEIASRLLMEMQGKGFIPMRKLVVEVICSICKTANPEKRFFRFLEMQLAIPGFSASEIYLFFIGAAGYAANPELATQVYNMMETSDVKPNWKHGFLLLHSYLRGNNIAQALHLFQDLLQSSDSNKKKKKLCESMIVSLCRANKPELAASLMGDMRSQSLRPSIMCYEELIRMYCGLDQFHNAVGLVNDMIQIPRQISSFMGNTFLFHVLRSPKLYLDWVTYAINTENLTDACWKLGHLTGVFSGFVEGAYDNEDIEKLIQQSFPMDNFTINMLLRRASLIGPDYACEYFGRLCEKGFEPDQWSYYCIVYALAKDGRMTEARKWMAKMRAKGYHTTAHPEDTQE